MRGSLGEKIGEGAYADVHAWAPGQVVKLFKPNIPLLLSWHEARMTRAAFAAGAPAPEMFGVMTLEGRFAMVLSRFDGPTLLQLSRSGALTHGQAGAILATLILALDLASTHFLLAEIAPEVADDPERPRAVNAALQSEYARLAGVSQVALRSAIESYLPVAYVRALFGEAMHAHQERMIRRIEAALRPED
jgi:hypothetical protein